MTTYDHSTAKENQRNTWQSDYERLKENLEELVDRLEEIGENDMGCIRRANSAKFHRHVAGLRAMLDSLP